ncbi:MAG: flagellin, partial [Pseudomonadota bacterium]
MALKIAHNIAAMNTHRWLSVSDAAMAKNLQRLSSGYRINSGADDAAGLAVSQAFRADLASYKVASRNASEASSLLQVADGALDQIGNILTRLKELATQASSANVSSANRAKLNSEYQKLILEADRIADSTKYGTDKLIDGTYGVTILSTGVAYNARGISGVTGMQISETYSIMVTAGSDATHWDIQVTTGNATQYIQDALADPATGATTDVYFATFGLTVTFADT